jgi:hypothetical protein
MSVTFVAETRGFEGSPELETEWFIGTANFSGGAFNPFPDGGPGSVPIEHFIAHMSFLLDEMEAEGDAFFSHQKAMSFWLIAQGAQIQGAKAVSWA